MSETEPGAQPKRSGSFSEESARFIDAVLDAVGAFVVVLDRNGCLVRLNPACQEATGYTPEEVRGKPAWDLLAVPEEAERVKAVFGELCAGHFPSKAEYHWDTKDGRRQLIAWSNTALLDADGSVKYVVGTGVDITERKRAEAALAGSRQEYVDLVNTIDGIIWAADPEQFRFTFVSKQAERLLSYPVGRWTSEPAFWQDHVHPDDLDSVTGSLMRAVRTKKPCELEFRMVARDGRTVWLRDFVRVVVEGDRPVALRGVMVDITPSKHTEQTLYRTAFHDPLTNLPNRALFEERLAQALRRSRRHPGHRCAVLFLDLDHFKGVNDSLGHVTGNRLLVEVAGRLARCVRDTDTLARFGGDEFAVLLEDFDDGDHIIDVAERIRAAVRKPFVIDQHEVLTTCSIGVALAPTSGRGPKSVLRDADIAMYRAKNAGRDCSMTFNASMHTDMLTRMTLEAYLRRAVERQELELHYQEICAASSGELAGMEALLRWWHPELGLLKPERFLSVAEEAGLMVPIGWWVIEEACRQAATWQKQEGPTFRIHVNLSGRQLAQPDLVGGLAKLLEATGLGAGVLQAEVTETAIMETIPTAARKLEELKELGLGLVIDNFGTGYSSLSRLRALPIDAIKIDRSFIEDLRSEERDSSLVEAVISLARNLGKTVIAEGVETAEQLERLREMGCDYVQGYYVSAPLDRDSASARLRDGTKATGA